MLEHEPDKAKLLLNVLFNHYDRLLVIGNGIGLNLGGIGTGSGDVLEHFLNLGFGVVHVNVADDDQCLVVGAIPLVVVVTQHLIGEVVHDIHRADHIALGILRAGEQVLQLAVAHAFVGIAAQSPLLVDDTALLVNFLVGEQQAVAPIFEHEQARIQRTLAGRGHVVDVIDGLSEIGIGIHV